MKFQHYTVFYRTTTKWIRDGWELVQSFSNSQLIQFFLEKDGVRETFVLFYSESMYLENSDLIAAAE